MAPGDFVRRRKKEKEAREKKQKEINFKKLSPENQRRKLEFRKSQEEKITAKQVRKGDSAPSSKTPGKEFDAVNAPSFSRSDFATNEAYERAVSSVRDETKRSPQNLTAGQQEAAAKQQEEIQSKAREFLKSEEGEVRPQRQELGEVETTAAQDVIASVPIIGPAAAALGNTLLEITEGEGMETLIQDPETAREIAKQLIQEEVIKEGVSGRESFGALIESIPIAGGLIAKYANGLIETPGGNALTIKTEIAKMGNIATNMREKSVSGKMGDPYNAFKELTQMEDDIAAAEQRIHLLILQSATLQADGDMVNSIETTIKDAKQRIFDAKQSASVGLFATASDQSLNLELQELKGGK